MLKPYQRPDLKRLNLNMGIPFASGGGALLAGFEHLELEKTAHSIALIHTPPDDWRGALIDRFSVGLCRARESAGRFLALGDSGELLTFGDGAFATSQIGPGIYTNLGSIAGRPHAVGMRGLIRRQGDDGQWQSVEGATRHQSFVAIAGASESEIYAVGWEGTICMIEGQRLTTIDSPTNRILSGVCCGADGQVYCCGQRGTLLRGRGHRWSVIEQDKIKEDLWDIHAFQGRIFVATMRFLYELLDDELKLVTFDDEIALSCYRLASVDDRILWSIGTKDLMAYDGKAWTRIL